MKVFVKEHSSDGPLLEDRSSPWYEFFEVLRNEGFEFVGSIKCAEFLIANNVPSKSFLRKCAHIPLTKRTLILWESFTTKPANFKEDINSKFHLCLSPSYEWLKSIQSSRKELFKWPHTNPKDIKTTVNGNASRLSRFVILSSNNFSSESAENYSLRRDISYSLRDEVDLWGRGWNLSKYKKLVRIFYEFLRTGNLPIFGTVLNFMRGVPGNHGAVSDRFELMTRYKYAIIVENSNDYVSEKLVDAIICGVIPIYIGPKLGAHGYPTGICLQVDGSVDAVRSAINELKSNAILCQEILESGKEFLVSKVFAEMINREALKQLANKSITDWLKGNIEAEKK